MQVHRLGKAFQVIDHIWRLLGAKEINDDCLDGFGDLALWSEFHLLPPKGLYILDDIPGILFILKVNNVRALFIHGIQPPLPVIDG